MTDTSDEFDLFAFAATFLLVGGFAFVAYVV